MTKTEILNTIRWQTGGTWKNINGTSRPNVWTHFEEPTINVANVVGTYMYIGRPYMRRHA